jgi:hypothetical protein
MPLYGEDVGPSLCELSVEDIDYSKRGVGGFWRLIHRE